MQKMYTRDGIRTTDPWGLTRTQLPLCQRGLQLWRIRTASGSEKSSLWWACVRVRPGGVFDAYFDERAPFRGKKSRVIFLEIAKIKWEKVSEGLACTHARMHRRFLFFVYYKGVFMIGWKILSLSLRKTIAPTVTAGAFAARWQCYLNISGMCFRTDINCAEKSDVMRSH